MRLLSSLAVIACLASLPALAAAAPPGLDITLAHGTPSEARTRDQLLALARRYPITPWLYTRRIVVEDGVIPHSHPILTMSTRAYPRDLYEPLQLATLLHEEAHHFVDERQPQTAAALAELRARYATLPVGFPDGADSLESSYLHLAVIYAELHELAQVRSPADAERVRRFWQHDHYGKLYELVGRDDAAIGAILRRHDLVPAGL